MNDCLFCKIAGGEIPTKKVYEDEQVYAFYDIDPKAPVHFLVIPKTHIPSAADLQPEQAGLVGHVYTVIARLTHEMGLAEKGFRVVTNVGQQGGQTVSHLHFHVLAGRDMTWPPG